MSTMGMLAVLAARQPEVAEVAVVRVWPRRTRAYCLGYGNPHLPCGGGILMETVFHGPDWVEQLDHEMSSLGFRRDCDTLSSADQNIHNIHVFVK